MNAQHVWMAQATQAPRISREYIRHQASNLERGIRRRAALNYIVGILICVLMGWRVSQPFFFERPLLLAAAACYAALLVYSMYRLHRYVASQVNTADAGVLDTLRFHRRQLERQRDFRRGMWRWQLPALLPAFGLQVAAMVVYSAPWQAVALFVATISAAIAVGLGVGEYRARLAQREIDALDSLAGAS